MKQLDIFETEHSIWKETLIDRLVALHIYSDTHQENPRQALHDIIDWEVKIALDPLVSSDAVALIEKHGGSYD
tara:strand:- start:1204 stop:1422 length:219 start_codon:yes stop_codon:yes gene_type:complete